LQAEATLGCTSGVGDRARQHFVPVFADQDAILDSNATEPAQFVHAIPSHAVVVLSANIRVVEHMGRKVDSRFNRHYVSSLERQINA
jgi:hypothetical protein